PPPGDYPSSPATNSSDFSHEHCTDSLNSSSQHSHSLPYIASSRPKIFERDPRASPEERPYLGSFTAHSSQLAQGGYSPDEDESSSLHGTFGHPTHDGSPIHSREDDSDSFYTEESSAPLPPQLTPPATSSYEVRNPDAGEGALPLVETGVSNSSPYISHFAGRSMSLISECTEPASREGTGGSTKPSMASDLPPMTRTYSPSGFTGHDYDDEELIDDEGRQQAEVLNVGPTDALKARIEQERLMSGTLLDLGAKGPNDGMEGLYTPPLSVDPKRTSLASASEILRSPTIANPNSPSQRQSPFSLTDRNQTPSAMNGASPTAEVVTPPAVEVVDEGVAQEEPATVFGNGVRFGYPEPCAREHSCAMDGLHSTAPFPTGIELSTFVKDKHRRTFAVEAATWASLLKFLMWYGDCIIQASAADVSAEDSRHCDASLSLEFRPNDEGTGVIRFTMSLLPPNHSFSTPELALVPPTPPASIKGKGRAATLPSTRFILPDHPVLPMRMSSLAISLYTLRHLANIALSTQPAKDAAESYHALRSLGLAISNLAREHSGKGEVKREQAKAEEEKLMGKLKERLRRMKPGHSGGGGGNKLVKPPPPEPLPRTQQLSRREGVLSSSDFDSERRTEGVLTDLRCMPTV
ncbi:hypothetical protein P7C70_g5152, partial [Phenoliferia sp. Uapishka_3]